MWRIQSSREERQECKMCCERTSQCCGDSDEGVTVLVKEDRMKKDKEVAYRGSDIGAESWRRRRILTDGEGVERYSRGREQNEQRYSKHEAMTGRWQEHSGTEGNGRRPDQTCGSGNIWRDLKGQRVLILSNRELSKVGSGIIGSTLEEWLGVT